MSSCQFDDPLIATNQRPSPLVINYESSTSTRKNYENEYDTSTTILSFKLETGAIEEESIPNTASFDYKELTDNLEPIFKPISTFKTIFKPLIELQCGLEPIIEIQRSLQPLLEIQRSLKPLIEIYSFIEPLIQIQSSIEPFMKLSYLGIKGLNNLQKNEIIELEPMIKDQGEFQKFYDREEWIESQRKNYSEELIAFIKKNEDYVLIAHSKTEKNLLKQLDILIEKKVIDQEDIIYFDS